MRGVETLYDDRELRAGEKFSDADLIGIPLRVTVSERSLKNGGVEVKQRSGQESTIVASHLIHEHIQSFLAAAEEGISRS